jgi:hypothetical protein
VRHRFLSVALSSLVLAGLSAPPAPAAAARPESSAKRPAPAAAARPESSAKRPAPAAAARPESSAKRPPRATPGLETIIQDDGLLLFRPPEEVRAAVARMKALGIDRVRITASWSSLTRAPELDSKPEGFDATDPAAYEQARWEALDTAMRAIRAAGLHALIDIGFWAPHWATTDPPGPRARTNIDPQAYADFALAVARRYSGGFTPQPDPPGAPPPAPSQDQDIVQAFLQPLVPFPLPDLIPPMGVRAAQTADAAADGGRLPAVDEFILWNEPNHQGLLLPQWQADGTTPASPVVYRAMVRAAYAAVKTARTKVKVLIGNTSSTGGSRGTGAVPPLEFLRELACVDRNLRPRTTADCAGFTTVPGDGWSHHPYSQNERPSRVSDPRKEPGDLRLGDLPVLARTLDKLVKMGRLARANRDIYLTEFGYETGGIPGRPRVSAIMQARWLTWAEYLADKVPSVRSFAQFLLRDQPPAPVRVSASNARPFGEYSTGLLVAGGNDKPAARTFLAGLFAQLQRRGRVLLYGRLRLGHGVKTVLLQRQLPRGGWRLLERLRIDGRAAFTRTIAHRPGALYRLTYPDSAGHRRPGLAIKPVPADR